MKKKILFSIILGLALVLSSFSVALADEYEHNITYVDAYDIVTKNGTYELASFLQQSDDNEAKASFMTERAHIQKKSAILCLEYFTSNGSYVRIIYSSNPLEYRQYQRPGNTWWDGSFVNDNAISYVIDIEFRSDFGTVTCNISFYNSTTAGLATSFQSDNSSTIDDLVHNEIAYSNYDIYYMGTETLFYEANTSDQEPDQDEVTHDFYVDSSGLYVMGQYLSFDSVLSVMSDSEKSLFISLMPYIDTSHVVYLCNDPIDPSYIQIAFSPERFSYDSLEYENGGYVGFFTTPSRRSYLLSLSLVEPKVSFLPIDMVESFHMYSNEEEADVGTFNELVYSNFDIYYLDTDEIFYKAKPTSSGSDNDDGGSSDGSNDGDSGEDEDLSGVLGDLVDGYDNTKDKENQDAFDNALSMHESQEHALLDEAMGNVNNVDMDLSWTERLTATFSFIRTVFMAIVTASGDFGILITVTLCFALALFALGWFRS